MAKKETQKKLALKTGMSGLYTLYRRSRLFHLFGRRSSSLGTRLAFVLMLAAIAAGFATYGALNAMPPFGDDPDIVFWLLNLDLIILLLLMTLIGRRFVSLWSHQKKGQAGAKLHVRLVFVFSLLAGIPAIIMTIFSAFFLHYGVQSWFTERISTAVSESQAVAEAYLEEHQQVIRADVLAMANDLNRQAPILIGNQSALDKLIQTQSVLRNLSEVIVFTKSGQILARSGMTFTLEFELIPDYALEQADSGEVVLMTAGSDDRVRALTRLDNYADAYLFVGRMVDTTVLRHLNDTRMAVQEYTKLESQRSDLQVTITMIFFAVALLLLLTAMWFGLIFARQFAVPISGLITASDRIRSGDLTVRVTESGREDEFAVLARAFNRMTQQIQEQRDELIAANRQLDHRRRFTETILAGVSSGIVGIDKKGSITLVNNSAADMFQYDAKEMIGLSIAWLLPELKSTLQQAHEKPKKITQAEIPYIQKDETRRIFLVRIAIELIGEEDQGAVLTFDDITELQSAQRKAAWADVARRIAHEIKNPLTPIQLSAERLKRRYLEQIKDDPEIFSQCTDTIIHHVGDIGRMVDEFSAFARMPEPVMHAGNLLKNIKDTLFLERQAHPDIEFTLRQDNNDDTTITVCFDERQIRQALTNILQNAIESIETRIKETPEEKGHLDILVLKKDDEVAIAVTDNGLGLPKNEDPNRLTEPYVTHREKGTGLGLAIVKKIMDDHKGRIVIGTPSWLSECEIWKPLGGATVSLVLPLAKEHEKGRAGQPPRKKVNG